MIDLDERLKLLMDEGGARFRLIKGAPFWGDSEAGFILTENGSLFDVFPWSKGKTLPPTLTGATSHIAQVYLAVSLGNDWRGRHGMRFLRIVTPDSILPPGFEVIETPGCDRLGLRILGDPEIVLGDLIGRVQAVKLARALVVPFDDLIASYRHPDGLPAFPQG